jgi:hypothetical protein
LILEISVTIRQLVEDKEVDRSLQSFFGSFPIVYLIATLFGVSGCFKQPAKYQEGTESSDLVQQLKGVISIGQGRDAAAPDQPRIFMVSCSKGKMDTPVKPLIARSISGPSRKGTIAYIESGWDDYKSDSWWWSLRVCNTKGKLLATRFTVYGDNRYKYGEHISMSPDGRYVAYLLITKKTQMPTALLTSGTIIIWDLNNNETINTRIVGLDDYIEWFPNSEDILFTSLVPRQHKFPASPFGASEEKWQKYPVAYVYNLKSREARRLHPGIHSHLSQDGKSVLLLNGGTWTLVDVESLNPKQLNVPPGFWIEPRVLLNDQKCLYVGYPTRGTKIRWIKYGSFSYGSVMGALKIADLNTWEFQTVVPYFDYRDQVSFALAE